MGKKNTGKEKRRLVLLPREREGKKGIAVPLTVDEGGAYGAQPSQFFLLTRRIAFLSSQPIVWLACGKRLSELQEKQFMVRLGEKVLVGSPVSPYQLIGEGGK